MDDEDQHPYPVPGAARAAAGRHRFTISEGDMHDHHDHHPTAAVNSSHRSRGNVLVDGLITPPPPPPLPTTFSGDAADAVGLTKADKEKNCERRRPEEDHLHHHPRQPVMSPQLLGQAIAPFLKDHIPGIYAPAAKTDLAAEANSESQDVNSKYCYRHRPDSKCRRAADESKMIMIQSELELLTPADQHAITTVWNLFSAAPSRHRNLMLQGIITQCCFPNLSLVAREVQEQLKIDFLTALPAEISYRILCYLDAVSLCRASQVSRRWRELADDDHVWHRICEQHIDRKCTKCGLGLPLLERKKLRDWTRQQQLAKSREEETSKIRIPTAPPTLPAPNTPRSRSPFKRDARDLDDEAASKRRCISRIEDNTSGPSTTLSPPQEHERRFRGWKSVYKERFKVGSNWKSGRCSIKIFRGHTNGVTCLQMDDNVLATGSYDATIRLWDIETGQEFRQFRGHTRGIRAIQFDEKILVSGSLDATVKIWNYHTGELLNTLACHTDGVLSVNFDGEFLASGSIDQTVKVFNLKTKESFALKGHTDWVNQVRICTASRTLFSASDDLKIKLWDLDSRRCIRTFEGHVGHVQQVLPLPPDFEPDDIPGASLDNTDALSAASGRSATPSGHHHSRPGDDAGESSASQNDGDEPRAAYGSRFLADPSTPLPARYILSGALDSTIRCWDTATGRCVRTFFGHLEGIWALASDTLRVVSGANDAIVKVWEPRSGKCERTFTGHRGPVTCVDLSDSRLASGSEDGEVRLYSFLDSNGLEEQGTPS